MYLISTLLVAMAATIAWLRLRERPELNLGLLALMFWGASLMWLVDVAFVVAEGEAFFETTTSAMVLGVVVVVAGLAVWGVPLVLRRRFGPRPNE